MKRERNPFAPLSPYELRHLVVHLVEAGRPADVYRLLSLETTDGRNAWYEAREETDDMTGYAADVGRALTAAQTVAPADTRRYGSGSGRPPGVGLAAEYRYRLLLASVSSLSSRVSPPLLAALVEAGLWSLADGVDAARRAPEAAQRAEALALLVPHADEPLRSELVWETLRTVGLDQRPGAGTLAAMAPHVPDALRGRVLDALVARVIAGATSHDASAVADTVGTVAGLLSPDQVAALLAAALPGVEDPPKPSNLGASLWREKLVEELAPYATGALAQRVYRAVGKIDADWRKAAILKGIAGNLPPAQRAQAQREAVAAATRWDDARILTEVVPIGDPGERAARLARAMAAAQRQETPSERAVALLRLVPTADEAGRAALSGPLREAAAAMRTEDMLNPYALDDVAGPLRALPADLRQEVVAGFLATGRRLRPDDRCHALAAVAAALDEPARTDVLAEAVASLRKVSHHLQSFPMRDLAPVLPAPLLEEALTIVRTVGDEEIRLEARAALAPYRRYPPDADLLAAARAAVGADQHRPSQVLLLAAFAGRLSGPARSALLVDGLELAVGASNANEAADALAVLAPFVAAEHHRRVRAAWDRQVKRTRKVRNPLWRAQVFAGLLAAQPAGGYGGRPKRAQRRRADTRARVLAEALAAAHQIDGRSYRAVALAALIPQAAPAARAALWAALRAEALDAAHTRQHWAAAHGAQLLARLLPLAPAQERPALLAEVETMADAVGPLPEPAQIRALATAADWAPPADRRRLLDKALDLASHVQTTLDDGLPAVAGRLEQPRRSRVLADALGKARGSGYFPLWRELTAGLDTVPADEFHRIVRTPPAAVLTRDRTSLCYEIQYLAPLIARHGGAEEAEDLAAALEDVGRWWP